MTQEEAVELLFKAIDKKKRHPYYKRVTSLATDYFAYVTGEGLDGMLEQFVKRETEVEFEQRVNLTKHIVPAVVSNLTAPERKVPRSNGKIQVVEYKDKKSEEKLKDLNEALGKFWGNKSLDDWMATRWLELNDIDPNTFVVFEWGAFDAKKEHLQPYPYEVSSEQAIDFDYDNNILQWLIDCREEQIEWDGKMKPILRYTFYGMDFTIVFTQTLDEHIIAAIPKKSEVTLFEGFEYMRIGDNVYLIASPKPHETGEVPAMRVGFKRDEQTSGETYVAPYHDAVPYLEKTIKSNSEFDLTMALHAFPQKIIASPPCGNVKCNGGMVVHGENQIQCNDCGGTGYQIHKSAQDVIAVAIPRSPEEQLSLDNIVNYVSPDVALLEFMDSFIERLTKRCQMAMYNTDVFTKEEVSETATEKTIDLDNIYDTLFPLSLKYAADWEFSVHLIAKLTDLNEGLIAFMTFSKDFKFKGKDDLILERKNAVEAEAPDSVLRGIDDDLMRITTADDPFGYARYKTKQEFEPFSGKSQEEIIAIKTGNTVPRDIIVLDDNYGWIFDDIQAKDPLFYEKPREVQTKILMARVAEIIVDLDAQAPQNPNLSVEEIV